MSLKAFQKFGNTTEALAATTAIVESKLGKDLKKFLKKQAKGEQLGVSDPKLAGIIKDKIGVQCLHNSMVNELLRGIRLQMTDLITGLGEGELSNMVLGLSHSLCRYKLKFSPDKVDHMIIQAIGSLIPQSLPTSCIIIISLQEGQVSGSYMRFLILIMQHCSTIWTRSPTPTP